jgi:hypothetical protein
MKNEDRAFIASGSHSAGARRLTARDPASAYPPIGALSRARSLLAFLFMSLVRRARRRRETRVDRFLRRPNRYD